MTVRKAELKVASPWGMHARLAFEFAKKSEGFRSSVTVKNESGSGDGKDVMDVLALATGSGEIITVEIEGEDENAAIETLSRLVQVDSSSF